MSVTKSCYAVALIYPHGTRSLGCHLYWGMTTNVSFIKEMTQIRWLLLSSRGDAMLIDLHI